jgi:hypothetical protein
MRDSASSDPVDAAWTALLARWESDEAHRAFVGLATSLGQLPDAARRYRSVVDDGERGPQARAGLERVLAAAMATLQVAERPPRRPVHLGVPLAMLAALFLATMLAARATGIGALTSPVVFLGEVVVVALLPWRRWASQE